MKDKILELIAQYPKHFSKMVKKSPELYNWVMLNSQVKTNIISEMIYSAVHLVDNTCTNGKIKKFISITDGYRFCGTASHCQCAQKSVSEKVSTAKKLYTTEQKDKINAQRKLTTMQKYGVENNGQTDKAKQNREQYYKTLVRKPKPIVTTYFQKLNKKFKSIANIEFLTPEAEYLGVSNQTYYQFKCLTCNNIFDDYIDNGHVPKCKTCNPYVPKYTSQQETEVYKFVKSIVQVEVQQSNKNIINPYELDIVIPDLKIAIEYCGLYWHSEAQKSDKNYHIKKMNMCYQKGYRLITIFEDEWTQTPDIVKNRLTSILGKDSKIYARQCSIKQITSAQSIKFIEETHIQGSSVAKVAYGCFYNNDLVAVMTFGKPRYDKTAEYELIRYCSKGTIVGGASKLFSAFCKDFNPKTVISYCDMRWGTGNLYKKLNFKKVDTPMLPSYSYTDFVKRYHRSKFTKKKIVRVAEDYLKTEHQIMREQNMYRIWDCGQTKWIYNMNKETK